MLNGWFYFYEPPCLFALIIQGGVDNFDFVSLIIFMGGWLMLNYNFPKSLSITKSNIFGEDVSIFPWFEPIWDVNGNIIALELLSRIYKTESSKKVDPEIFSETLTLI
ncbi:hypothetical protein AWD85_004592 [Escherichia coli]